MKDRLTTKRARETSQDDVVDSGSHTHSRRTVQSHTVNDKNRGQPETAPIHPHSSDFDDRVLEVFLRGLLRMVAVTQRDAERSTAVIRDVTEVATSRQMYVEVYGSARTGILLPSSDLDFAIVPATEQQALATAAARRGIDHRAGGTLARAIGGEIESAPLSHQPVSIGSGGFAHLSKRERIAAAGQQLHSVIRALQNDRRFTRIRKILHAHVPIIKCVHRATNCEIDFSFTPDGIHSSNYIVTQLAAPELLLARGLVIIIKALLAQWGINDPSTGGLGSFPVALMVIWFLRSEGVHYEPGLKKSYTVHLLGFLKYYGEDFDYKNLAIDLNNMCTFKKYCTAEFIILNPLDTTRNAAKACSKFGVEVRRKFLEAFKTLLKLSLAEVCPPNASDLTKKEERDVVGSLRSMFFDTLQVVDRDHCTLMLTMNNKDIGSVEQHWTEDHVYYGGNVFAASSASKQQRRTARSSSR